ncbi:M55 family metallopeptidase [Anaerosalibacter massiliensis]|nr:M55 family metallopeptidase [Anaerosalibacter massiliensis]
MQLEIEIPLKEFKLREDKHMVHALIIADIEGITDIYDLKNIDDCVELYTSEIQVYIKTLFENDVTKITVCDAHDEGNLISRKIITHGDFGRGDVRIVSKVENLSFDEKYDFAILAGFHGMNGSPGILPHTLRFDFKLISSFCTKLQARIPIGEVELYTRWLGAQGIPVILVTGDREAVYEANCFNPYRQTCCVKSYFQMNQIDRIHFYEKIAYCIKCSLSLNWDICLSEDSNEIAIEFNNPDVVEALGDASYNRKENSIIFDSCSELVNNLYPLIDRLNEINNANVALNSAFIKEVRKLAVSLKKEDLAKSEIGPLLYNNLLFLDSKSRDKIMKGILAMTNNLTLPHDIE